MPMTYPSGDPGSDAAFRCEVSFIDDGAVVLPRGHIDLATAPVLLHDARATLVRPIARIVVDLRDTAFMDSSGISALNAVRLDATEHGIAFTLASVPPQPRMVLEITGLAELFGLAPRSVGVIPGATGGTAA